MKKSFLTLFVSLLPIVILPIANAATTFTLNALGTFGGTPFRGNGVIYPYMGIYILDGNTGAIIAGLNTNGISGGTYTPVVPGVSDDGVVYVCNQVSGSSATIAFKIYRWPTANTNDPNFNVAP